VAIKKTLTISGGSLELLQDSDSLQWTEELTNGGLSASIIGAPVYCDGDDSFKESKADALATSKVLGLVSDTSIASGSPGNVIMYGILEATTLEWGSVLDPPTMMGLTPGSVYYLSDTFTGVITGAPPTAHGSSITPIGVALTPTMLFVNPGTPTVAEHDPLLVATVTNNNASALVICRPVYSDGSGTVDLAQADASATAQVTGLVLDTSILPTASGNILSTGYLEASTGEWDVVTGGSGGLTAGSRYYLSAATAGALTTTAPSTTGDRITLIGKAVSTSIMKLEIRQVGVV